LSRCCWARAPARCSDDRRAVGGRTTTAYSMEHGTLYRATSLWLHAGPAEPACFFDSAKQGIIPSDPAISLFREGRSGQSLVRATTIYITHRCPPEPWMQEPRRRHVSTSDATRATSRKRHVQHRVSVTLLFFSVLVPSATEPKIKLFGRGKINFRTLFLP
jgi:hypothetical protein